LNPYSSTSFLRSSSASLRCFRFLQKKISASAIKATAAIGTTTATAIFPPPVRPDVAALLPVWTPAVAAPDVEEDDDESMLVPELGGAVDVMTITLVDPPSVGVRVRVITLGDSVVGGGVELVSEVLDGVEVEDEDVDVLEGVDVEGGAVVGGTEVVGIDIGGGGGTIVVPVSTEVGVVLPPGLDVGVVGGGAVVVVVS